MEFVVEQAQALEVRPCVKMVGGKRKLVPEIRKLMPAKFGRYFEPFFGGGAMFFSLSAKERKGAQLSDMNKPLVAMYQALRDEKACHEVVLLLSKPGARYADDRETFMKARRRNFLVGSAAERAADFLYCNKAGFNGLFRTNLAGEFNVPFGAHKALVYDFENLRLVGAALREATIELQEFDRIKPKKGDFVYLDPPYLPLSVTSSFTAYTSGGFGKEDHERLMKAALEWKMGGVHVVISNSAAPFIRELYSGPEWEVIEVQAARSVNSKGAGRGKIAELMIR